MAGLECWNCGESLKDVPRPISRHANCPSCYEVLHCCRMCKWYAPGRPNDCDHDRADPPVEKESANFCDYFAPTTGTYAQREGERKQQAKSKFAALFDEDQDEDAPADDASVDDAEQAEQDALRSKLDDLFKD